MSNSAKHISPGHKQAIEEAFVYLLMKKEARAGREVPTIDFQLAYPELNITQRILSTLKLEISEKNSGKICIGSNKKGFFLIKSWKDAIADETCYSNTLMSMLKTRKLRKRQYLKLLGDQIGMEF